MPMQGTGGNLNATLAGLCTEDHYTPSLLEQQFAAHPLEWTASKEALCHNLDWRHDWIRENMDGNLLSGDAIFSRLCKRGEAPQLLEPLAGLLRDPRVICDGTSHKEIESIEWLVLADHGIQRGGKNVLFDAGGTHFMDAMTFFVEQYEKRGIVLDKIYVWEANFQGVESYWRDTLPEVRQKWESRLTFYDGIPISADSNAEHNPVRKLLAECQPEDFCAFKLDVDSPGVESSVVEQILASTQAAAVLDEFFFEHHVNGLMQQYGWQECNGTFADSYNMFTRLRQMGVRAHSWI